MRKILLVGNDASLLRTRAWLLNRSETVEVRTTDPTELAQHANEQEFELLVLCHSLDIPARLHVSAEAHRRWPKVRVMQVVKDYYCEDCTGTYADDSVLACDPEQLVRHVCMLLESAPESKLNASLKRAAERGAGSSPSDSGCSMIP